ncbi:hypothetical protein D3C86_1650790 [compost metagenome]
MLGRLGAALHGQAVRLVQGDDHVVFIEDQRLGVGHVALGQFVQVAGLARVGLGQRRHAHGGAGGQAVLWLDPRTVDADLAAAGHLLDLDMGQVRPAALEPPIQTDVMLVFSDIEGLDFAAHAPTPVNSLRAIIRPTNRAAMARTTEPTA